MRIHIRRQLVPRENDSDGEFDLDLFSGEQIYSIKTFNQFMFEVLFITQEFTEDDQQMMEEPEPSFHEYHLGLDADEEGPATAVPI